MALPRRVQRLLAWVCLGAFLAANTPTASVAAHLLATLLAGAEISGTASHGRFLPAETTAPGSIEGRMKEQCRACLEPAEDAEDYDFCGPCCPNCPKGPCGSKCPIPGGCATCNVAKVPCATPPTHFIRSEAALDAAEGEPTSFYTPPSAGHLIRPPRA
jgi:hypothetical protein